MSIAGASTGAPRRQAGRNGDARGQLVMIALRAGALAGALLALVPAAGWAQGKAPAGGGAAAVKKLDGDHDGTLDLAEVKKAAEARFQALDRDHDGTLDAKELIGVLSAGELGAANPDRDQTLDRDEYLALVEKRFKAADPDRDGTLDAKELGSAAGRALLRLLQ
jgi:EF hand domain-containing protein